MAHATLTVDLAALAANWRALDARSPSSTETAAVIKADTYGLGTTKAAITFKTAGARSFFVAMTGEGVTARTALGPDVRIFVFAGHMNGDAQDLASANLIPVLNSRAQIARHIRDLPGHAYALQLDTGMNRLGLEAEDLNDLTLPDNTPELILSHLACSDEPDHPANPMQLANFRAMTARLPSAPRSLAATGGILLGPDYHFDLTRPGIGLYGGAPFTDATPVVRLDIPVIQIRDLAVGEGVGYGLSWVAQRPSRIATIPAGYADGLIRAMGNGSVQFYAEDIPCPLVGRVSMDLITVDVTALEAAPDNLSLLNASQGVDALATAAGTIGYEFLTSLGPRYNRVYKGA